MNDFLTRQLKAISRVDLSTSALLSPPPLPSPPLLSSPTCSARFRRPARWARSRAGGWKKPEEKKTLALEIALFEDRKSALAIGHEESGKEEREEGALGGR